MKKLVPYIAFAVAVVAIAASAVLLYSSKTKTVVTTKAMADDPVFGPVVRTLSGAELAQIAGGWNPAIKCAAYIIPATSKIVLVCGS